jgi:hypothetical protein
LLGLFCEIKHNFSFRLICCGAAFM